MSANNDRPLEHDSPLDPARPVNEVRIRSRPVKTSIRVARSWRELRLRCGGIRIPRGYERLRHFFVTLQPPRAPVLPRLYERRTNVCHRVVTERGPIVSVHLSFAFNTRSFRGDHVGTRLPARRNILYALTTSSSS